MQSGKEQFEEKRMERQTAATLQQWSINSNHMSTMKMIFLGGDNPVRKGCVSFWHMIDFVGRMSLMAYEDKHRIVERQGSTNYPCAIRSLRGSDKICIKFTLLTIFHVQFNNVKYIRTVVQPISRTLHLSKLKLYLLNNSPSSLLPAPSDNHSTFCLCEFHDSRCLR